MTSPRRTDNDEYGAPTCPDCAVLLHEDHGAHTCPDCGWTIAAPDVTLPAEFDGPDIHQR